MIDCYKDRGYIEELDRETVVELIDYIEVFKKEKVGNEYLQRIDIYFYFIGQIEGRGLFAIEGLSLDSFTTVFARGLYLFQLLLKP